MSTTSREVAVRLEEPGGDDIHLRDVLEAQPVTLIRLGCDGRVLAINDAGRAVIGAERLEQILETSFTDVLQEGEHSGFLAFLEHVAAGHRGSLELSLTAFTGNRFTMRLHATPHPGSPDGIKSVLVTLLDITESRRLEQSLVEAMARQTDQEAAHEAERERLSADLRAAELERATALGRHAKDLDALTEAFEHRQQVSDEQASRLERLADLEPRFTELSERYNATEAAVGTLTDELEKSRLEADAARAHAQELDQRRQNAESTLAALTQEAAQRREDAEAVRTGLEQELETGRRLLETANLETARHQADIAALREALETSMNTQAQAAARSKLEADIVAARLTVLETALAAAHSARGAAIARARQLSQETQRIARQFISQVAGADAELGTAISELGAQLEAAITTAVDGRLSVTMMVAAPDVQSETPMQVVQQALVALATNRSSVVANGRIVIEIAPVDIDEGASRSRGGIPAGAYVLVAMHVLAGDADVALAPELFECTDPTVWALAGSSLFTAFESMRLARGWMWLARERASDLVFELYVPRAGDPIPEAEIHV